MNIQRSIGRVSEGSTTAVDADGNTAHEVAETDGYASPKEGKAGVVCIGRVEIGARDCVDLGRKDNGHDDAVDGHDFAEDDGDEVLGADTGRLDASAKNRRAGNEDSPAVRVSAGWKALRIGVGGFRTMLRRRQRD